MKNMLKAFVFLLLVFSTCYVKSQNTVYFMEHMPQVLNYNPALVPKAGFFLGFPGIGLWQVQLFNSGFNAGKIIDYLDNVENSGFNPDVFVQKLNGMNDAFLESRADLISFGFPLKRKGFFSFSISQRVFAEMTAPRDFFYLLADNESYEDKMPLEIKGIYAGLNTFTQVAFTWSRVFFDKLTIGLSPKLIAPNFSALTDNLNFLVKKEEEDYETEVYGSTRIGLPIPINPAAIKNNDELDSDEILPEDWINSYGPGDIFRNAGFLIDLGGSYRLNEHWSLSASMLDLGGYRWKKNDYLFAYSDSVAKVKQNQPFRVSVPLKLFWAADYRISPVWNAGFLLKNTFYKASTHTSATLSMNGDIGKMLSASLSYTFAHTYDNLGLGIRLRFLPGTDLFVVTDNIIHAFNYRKVQEASVSIGVNITTGI